MDNLTGKTVAILATDGFEEVELTKPKAALEEAGAKTTIVSLENGSIQGFQHIEKGERIEVDLNIGEALTEEFDGLLLPGGVINPDAIRGNADAIDFVRRFFAKGKPVFAICHAPQILITAEVVEGRRLTSYHTIRKDLENAGARWVNESVVVDQGLVTSRNPNDIPDFIGKMLEELAEGVHAGQHP